MSNVTNIRLRVLPRFPSRIVGANGFTVVREDADLVVKPDYGQIAVVPAVPDANETFFQAWTRDIDTYNIIPFSALVANIQDVIIGPNLSSIAELDTFADLGMYFSAEGEATGYNLTEYVRTISGSADAAAFRTGLELGTAALAATSDFATATQGETADTALQPGEAATPSQGALADSALQPGEAATPGQGALADTAQQPAVYDPQGKAGDPFPYDTKADAEAATISAAIKTIYINGVGPYSEDDNGSTDTLTSSGETARTWYRVADVSASRLGLPLAFSAEAKPPLVDPTTSIVNDTTLDHTDAILLQTPAFTNPRGIQGVCWVPEKAQFFSTWNRANTTPADTERVNIVRHDRFGNVVDYGATTGPGSSYTGIDLGHGQTLDYAYVDGELTFFSTTTDGRGVSVFTHQDVASSSSAPDGYDIIVLAGQSNMAGTNTGAVPEAVLDASDPLVYEIRNGASSPSIATEPLGHPTSNLNGYGPGPGLAFGKLWAANKLRGNRKVLLLPVAVSSTGMTDSGPWAVGGSAYSNMLAQIAAAMALPGGVNRVVGLLWAQGETDANRNQVGGTSATQSEYTAALNAVIDGFRASTATAATAAIIVLGMSPAWVAEQSYRAGVEAALADTPTQRKWTAYVAGPSGYTVTGDALHFNPAGSRLRGQLAYAALDAAVDNTKGVAAQPGSYRAYTLQPEGVTAGTAALSFDKNFVIKTGGPYLGEKNIRMCRLSDLLALPPGDYSDKVGSLLDEMMQPDNPYANQGVTFDGQYVIMLNGDNDVALAKNLIYIRWQDKTVVKTVDITSGRKLAIAQNAGAGNWHEPEGLFWVVPGPGQKPQLWMGMGAQDTAGTGWSVFALPIFQSDVGAQPMNGNRSPLGIGANLGGGSRKITWPVDETLSFATRVTTAALGTVLKMAMAFKAFAGENLKFSVFNESTGAEKQVYEIDRVSGAMTWNQVPFQMGGSFPAIGTGNCAVDNNGRIVMSASAAQSTHILFRSTTNNAGAISSSGLFTTYKTSAAGAGLYASAGTPEDALSAGPGAICADITNGVIYVKKSGTGNTGWKLVTQAA